jgi:hypothetical protein
LTFAITWIILKTQQVAAKTDLVPKDRDRLCAVKAYTASAIRHKVGRLTMAEVAP